MENKKTNTWLKAILICASLALAFGGGIYVTSLLDQKADTAQNKTEKENVITDGSSASGSSEDDQDTGKYELPAVDVEFSDDEPEDNTVSSDEQEVDISGYDPIETPEPVSSDTEEQPASSGTEEQPDSSETWDEENVELPEVPVYPVP
jgi:hypothetical protein